MKTYIEWLRLQASLMKMKLCRNLRHKFLGSQLLALCKNLNLMKKWFSILMKLIKKKKALIQQYQSYSFQMVHPWGLEPQTHWLRVSCSTSWAKNPYKNAIAITIIAKIRVMSMTFFNFVANYFHFLIKIPSL